MSKKHTAILNQAQVIQHIFAVVQDQIIPKRYIDVGQFEKTNLIKIFIITLLSL